MTRFEKLRILVMIIALLMALEFTLLAVGFHMVYNDMGTIVDVQSQIIKEVYK